jgi:hypothetical protein
VKSKDLLFSFYLLIFWSLQRKNRFFDSGCASAQNDGVTPLNNNASIECYCKAKVLIDIETEIPAILALIGFSLRAC